MRSCRHLLLWLHQRLCWWLPHLAFAIVLPALAVAPHRWAHRVSARLPLPQGLGGPAFAFAFAVVIGHWYIRPTMDFAWNAIQPGGRLADEGVRPDSWQPRAVGAVERALYLGALLAGHAALIAVWLTLKTAAQWYRWREARWGLARDEAEGRSVYQNFLLGNGLSLAYAGLAYWSVGHVAAGQAHTAFIGCGGLLVGNVILTVWVWCRWQSRRRTSRCSSVATVA